MRNNPAIRQQMFEMIERWKQSGLSQKSFCEKESIKPYVFYYWYKRCRLAVQASENKSGFVKLKIEETRHTSFYRNPFSAWYTIVFS